MIGYYTDNSVSHSVMKHLSRAGVEIRHINDFDDKVPGIFYGMLRGSGVAMRILKSKNINFWYIDNGYFDAVYMDANHRKEMGGMYRVVKNAFLDIISPIKVTYKPIGKNSRVLVMPPSPYSAFMHDTTPEDWLMQQYQLLQSIGCSILKRQKDSKSPLSEDLIHVDAVLAFNSMGVMKAIQMGVPVFTTHGIVRNYDLLVSKSGVSPIYEYEEFKSFFEGKQVKLEHITEGIFDERA